MEGEKMGPGAHSKRENAKDRASQMLPRAPAAQNGSPRRFAVSQRLPGATGPQLHPQHLSLIHET